MSLKPPFASSTSWLCATALLGLLGGAIGVACGSNANPPTGPGTGGTGGPVAPGTGGMTGTPGGTGGTDPGPNPDAADPAEPEVQATACPVFQPLRLNPGTDGAQPSIIWTGTNYFVVWSSAPAGSGTTSGDIVGAFLNPDGTRASAAPDVVIADTPNLATSPELVKIPGAAGDDSYAVVFENCEGAGADPCSGSASSVASVVVGADGLAKGTPITLSPAAAVQRRPYLAAGLGNVYVTFRDVVAGAAGGAARTVARLARLDATGALVGTGMVLDETSDGQYPHVAVGPDRVALAYQRNKPTPDIVLALFDPTLAFQRELVVRTGLPSDATNPVVQWNTSRWIMAWEDERGGEEARIFASVVEPDGTMASVAEAAYDRNGNWPAIASGDLSTSLIGFYGYPGRRVFLARMQANGTLKPGQVVLGVGKFPSVAYNPVAGEYAVTYENEGIVTFERFKCAD